MTTDNLDETRPVITGSETLPVQIKPELTAPATTDLTPTENSATPSPEAGEPTASAAQSLQEHPEAESGVRPWRWLIALCFLALLFIAAGSAYGGYQSGINQRTVLEATQVAQQIHDQFSLGVQDLEAQRYVMARQRFEYVIQHDPAYPGVTEKLAEALLHLNIIATETPVPTPTLTPTQDTRGVDQLFSESQALLASGDWSGAIDTLLRLRKVDPAYQPVEVDSMLFVALRNRGVDKILKAGDLEGGTYDLAVAEKFGPLDVEASNYRNWADMYVTGVSFWELDWEKAIYWFEQIAVVAPGLRDGSNMTSVERYRLALVRYADFLAQSGEWCEAQEQYQRALDYSPNPEVEPTASYASDQCDRGDSDEDDGDKKKKKEQSSDEPTPTPEENSQPEEPPTEAPPTEAPPTEEPPTEEPPAETEEPYPLLGF
jgi:tetratricopeptide (TPR) repeat protein